MVATTESVNDDVNKVSDNEKEIMRGEFRGDFTRDSFNPVDRFSRVLMQQGRVQLDADWNEQISIMLHQTRSLACDLGGEHWGPNGNDGFKIEMEDGEPKLNFSIGAGHYYVSGLLCEVSDALPITFIDQPDYPLLNGKENPVIQSLDDGLEFLVYLDVWEQHTTYVNDDSIREVALGGIDTATRAKVVWQVKIIMNTVIDSQKNHPIKKTYQTFLDAIESEIKPGKGKLQVKVKDKNENDKKPCLLAPESRYRGAENQLYRVEIHKSGTASDATYKWSRENASVIFPITKIEGTLITLEHLGRDSRYGLKANDWVEIIDDNYSLLNRADSLLQIKSIDTETLQVTLKNQSTEERFKIEQSKHPYLRRWDQTKDNKDGVLEIENTDTEQKWINLEDGVQIRFNGLEKEEGGVSAIYQTGDYWLIPARTATGDVEWPMDDNDNPKAMLPHGVIHHYAPLAILKVTDKEITVPSDLRRIMKKSWV